MKEIKKMSNPQTIAHTNLFIFVEVSNASIVAYSSSFKTQKGGN